jgi:hypothetical protein
LLLTFLSERRSLLAIFSPSYAEARAPRGGVTRQGVVLTEVNFRHLLIVNKTSLPLSPPCVCVRHGGPGGCTTGSNACEVTFVHGSERRCLLQDLISTAFRAWLSALSTPCQGPLMARVLTLHPLCCQGPLMARVLPFHPLCCHLYLQHPPHWLFCRVPALGHPGQETTRHRWPRLLRPALPRERGNTQRGSGVMGNDR